MDLESSPAVVHAERVDRIRVISIDNPPVNALSHAVRSSLLDAVGVAQAESDVDAILIVGSERGFIAGADIREFGARRGPPTVSDICRAIEDSVKPVVAAIYGTALGGGLEVALAAHYRLAMPNAKLGLPEVNLGLLPGAGGTQRTPRLIGVKAAADLIFSGRHVPAQEALALGLIDRLGMAQDAREAGLAYARELLAAGAKPRRTRDMTSAQADQAQAMRELDAAKAQVDVKSRNLFSHERIYQALLASLQRPFDEGLQLERELFMECQQGPQHAGLVHAFFAERQAAKVPESRNAEPRPVGRIGVVGGGTMGAGIAVAALDAGLPVVMVERDGESAARGRSRVEKVYDSLIARGRMTAEAKADMMSRFATSSSYADLASVDLVIEAVFEDMAAKQAVFAELDRVCKAGAVLATNTSYLNIDEIARDIARPRDVIGLHFFSPANIMKLLEIVVTTATHADVAATAFAFARKLRKVPVRAGLCDGFIGNRINSKARRTLEYVMEDGASPYQIDEAVRTFGYPMGPFQTGDLAGGDIGWATRKRRAATRDPAERYVQIADRICERGWFGQKSGRGYYLYEDGSRVGKQNPEVLAIIEAERQRAGIQPRDFSSDEIIRRWMAAMINEGANVVHEGIALRPLDIDVTFLNGFGYPRYRGGPMKYADTVGLDTLLADIRRYAQEDPFFWKPSPLLVELVSTGRDFGSLNHISQNAL